MSILFIYSLLMNNSIPICSVLRQFVCRIRTFIIRDEKYEMQNYVIRKKIKNINKKLVLYGIILQV